MKTRKILALVVALTSLALAAAACGSKAGASPTATAKAFYDAVKAKDATAIKATMSKSSLDMMEKFAKAENKSLDEMLKEPNSSKQPPAFESQNESITGDTASIEVKDENGKWEKLPFVKEDGAWKIALDKAMQSGMSGNEPGKP
ncbi:MAG: hypothetical protein QOJ02_3099 [Acidobacteriota bacterium]|jgi:ABC-type phosphate transport system substrate-binding protein|nr:hypothetical protein [Acidobacteriota bacterium]